VRAVPRPIFVLPEPPPDAARAGRVYCVRHGLAEAGALIGSQIGPISAFNLALYGGDHCARLAGAGLVAAM
jgi:hypothetical protein